MHAITFWLAMLALAWVPDAQAGGVFRWQSADGTVHFADTPGVPEAERFEPGRGLSVVDSVALPKRPPSEALARELRWQQQGNREMRREHAKESARRDSQCATLRKQRDGVEAKRASGKASDKRRLRLRELEDRLWRECR